MPSFGDSAFIFILALLLFGPKKLPELARQLGKLMAEFRRASNEFRMQMDEELRVADQVEQQKKIAAMEAAAPVTPPTGETGPEQSDLTPSESEPALESTTAEPLPIASQGDLDLMPPETGLPTPRVTGSETETATTGFSHSRDHTGNAALTPLLETIPHTPDPSTQQVENTNDLYLASLPDRHTNHSAEIAENSTETPIHG